jgi:RNA polymerase sigma-70 factor, ECF subfamily
VFDPLQRYLRRRLDPEDASDVLSETLLVIWRRLDEVPKENPLPWSYGVARRLAANQRRSRKRHLQLVERMGRERPPPASPAHDDPALESALQRLSESDRELLRLWAWEQLEPREIATVLGLTVNAATLRLSRARKRLAEEMTRQDPIAAGHKTERHPKEHRND